MSISILFFFVLDLDADLSPGFATAFAGLAGLPTAASAPSSTAALPRFTGEVITTSIAPLSGSGSPAS
jgi:hypothetical protein